MRIAYIGPNRGSSLQRARALQRLGHDTTVIDLRERLSKSLLADRWVSHTSAFALQAYFAKRLFSKIQIIRPNLIWVDQEPFLGPTVIQKLRAFGLPIVNYTIDDPFSTTPFAKQYFRSYRNAVAEYDLIAAVREVNIDEIKMAGGRNVLHIFRSADETAHFPRALTESDYKFFSSEVVFVGTWMPERGPFMADLARQGVPLSIWGDAWDKADEWSVLRSYWRGSGLTNADEYAKAIQCAKINLGLLSKGNRDLHTQRSLEIPALGGLLCAERTSEHQALYLEDEEAVFWADAEECAIKCKWLLEDAERREKIRQAGHARCVSNGYFNEQVLRTILTKVDSISEK